MAVAMDLPDDQSPYGSIHPRDKATVADRLILGARNIVYGDNVNYQGPILESCEIVMYDGFYVAKVYYRLNKNLGLVIKNRNGFEVCIF